MKTHRNSRTIQARASDGSFRRWTGDDVGIGVCPKCNHLTTQPEMPDSLKSGFVDPCKMREWRDARECKACGWSSVADKEKQKAAKLTEEQINQAAINLCMF